MSISTITILEKKPSKHVLKQLNIALVNVTNNSKDYAMNKDLNGGFGTADDYGNSFTSKIIRNMKKKNVRLPIISLAFLQALLKEKNYNVKYFEGHLPKANGNYNIILIYGTVIDYK